MRQQAHHDPGPKRPGIASLAREPHGTVGCERDADEQRPELVVAREMQHVTTAQDQRGRRDHRGARAADRAQVGESHDREEPADDRAHQIERSRSVEPRAHDVARYHDVDPAVERGRLREHLGDRRSERELRVARGEIPDPPHWIPQVVERLPDPDIIERLARVVQPQAHEQGHLGRLDLHVLVRLQRVDLRERHAVHDLRASSAQGQDAAVRVGCEVEPHRVQVRLAGLPVVRVADVRDV